MGHTKSRIFTWPLTKSLLSPEDALGASCLLWEVNKGLTMMRIVEERYQVEKDGLLRGLVKVYSEMFWNGRISSGALK